MDFTRQASPAHQIRPTTPPGAEAPGNKDKSRKGSNFSFSYWSRIGAIVLLFATTILVAAMAFLIYFGNNNESKLVDPNDYQAVFINDGSSNGQAVYFGHITALTDQYIRLQNVYYITASSSGSASSSNSYSLTKLGCQQLHDPTDQMVINRAQVAFWENLNSSGKVVQTIQQFVKQNPNGPNCSATTGSTSTSTTPQNASGTGNSAATTQNSASGSSTGTASGSTSTTTGTSTKKP